MLTAFDLHPAVVAIDATVSCPLLPSYVAAAAQDAHAIFKQRNAEKDLKHLDGCCILGRSFMAIVFTTLGGIGPQSSLDWISALYTASFARERLAGGSGFQTAQRKQRLFQSLQSCLTRSCETMIDRLVLSPAVQS